MIKTYDLTTGRWSFACNGVSILYWHYYNWAQSICGHFTCGSFGVWSLWPVTLGRPRYGAICPIPGRNNNWADYRFAPSQWETALLCNDVSHWLGANLESALYKVSVASWDTKGAQTFSAQWPIYMRGWSAPSVLCMYICNEIFTGYVLLYFVEVISAKLVDSFNSYTHIHQGPLLLTWFNFNPSMDN